ncbi:aryl-sulfate sulfotransferase [Paraliobacillus zengyii]|uniref:aryl-sulfate sulfotransferase n=1 Tax=Paraliobacillus zengyii TaxID=2213194 RepID=UPI001F545949|nr:aryl-sulfate sulfotransferase [Paraliobacillus zengyii]
MKKISRLSLLILVVVVVAIAYIVVNGNNEKVSNMTNAERGDLVEQNKAVDTEGLVVSVLEDGIEEQEVLEESYLEILENEAYTEENMYVVKDPYENSPLTALALFQTEEPSKITVTVPGSTDATTITHTYDTYETKHEIPILGLLPDSINEVKVSVETETGKVTEQMVSIETEVLPDYIGTVDIEEADTEQMELGDSSLTFFIASTKYSYAFDSNGDVRWYNTRYNSHVLHELENGHILYLTKEDNSSSTYNELVEMDYLGKYYKAFYLNSETVIGEAGSDESTMIHHDAIELPNGNYLLTINGDSNYIEDVMVELDSETGEIVKSIDLKDLLPESFYEEYDATERDDGKIDWFHQNAVVYDESDDSIIVSSRNQDLIMKIDYTAQTFTKDQIVWILADEEGWPEEYQDVLIEGIGDDFKYSAGQHAPEILPDQDNQSNTIDVLLYDNNVVVTRGNEELSDKYSRGVVYRIDENGKTAEEMWSFGEELGEEYFTYIVGSARYMEVTGNYLIDFGYVNEDERSGIFEVNQNGEIVWHAEVSEFPEGARAYRAERLDLYNNWEYSLSN